MTEVTSFDRTRLAVTTWGPSEAPTVVLVHGLGLSIESWGRVPEMLADGHRVVGYDLRGHGRSGDAEGGDYSLSAHARDLDAVLRAVVADDDRAVVVGNSLGGGIVVARAHLCGNDRVAGAVFAGSGGSGVTFPGFPARGPRWVRTPIRWVLLKVLRVLAVLGRRIRPVEQVSDGLVRRAAFTSTADRELVARVREDFLSSRPRALAATTLASVSHDGTRLAPALDVPTLVLHGSADPEVPDAELERLLAALPDAEVVSLTGEGHMLPLTQARVVTEHVAGWVRRVGA